MNTLKEILVEMNNSDIQWDELAIKTINDINALVTTISHLRYRNEIKDNKDVINKLLDAGIQLDSAASDVELAIRSLNKQ